MTSSICPPSSSPVPRMMAFLMLSEGMETFLAATIAVRSRGLPSGSPPERAAIWISLMSLVNIFPRFASVAAFLCLIVAHFEWPDMLRELRVRADAERPQSLRNNRIADNGGTRATMPLKTLISESQIQARLAEIGAQIDHDYP